MKIICPEHNGLIEIPARDIADAYERPLNVLVFTCPVCEEEVFIRNIQAFTDIGLQ